MSGNYFASGDYDGCLSVRTEKPLNISGQYCSVVILPSSKFSSEIGRLFDALEFSNFVGVKRKSQMSDLVQCLRMTYGLCIPRSCSIANLQKLWDYLEITFRIPVHLLFLDSLCDTADNMKIYFHDICIYLILATYFAVLLIATIYDVFYRDESENEKSILACFSLYSNSKKLFTLEDSPDKMHYLQCLSGLKVLGMLWVIYGHRVMFNGIGGATNAVYIHKDWKYSFPGVMSVAAVMSVDMFFSLSGLLLSYGYLSYRNLIGRSTNMNLLALQLYRLLRIWPGLIAMIMFSIGVFKLMGSGPFWSLLIKKIGGSCLINGWSNLLFVNNYIEPNYQCLDQTWYLAVDSQLFMLSPILLISMCKAPLKTCLACIGACVISGLYAFILTYQNEYGAIYYEGNREYHRYIYLSTFVRMPSWLIGFVTGVILYNYRNVKLKQVTVLFGWAFSILTLVYLVMAHSSFLKNDYDLVKAALFNSAARPAWSIAICVIVFLCSSGHGGMINKFLSLKLFQVLVRMSYSIYLVHVLVIIYFVGTKKHSEEFSNIKIFRDLLSDLFFTFIASTICCLAFESPFIQAAKVIFKKEMVKHQKAIEMRKKEK
ncbi:unnamed protein product [Acanthoscelides obtectus]|nr:unnamed protein product [Acanthoscelides obtectus]CAK1642950.1 Nose resistant to fluoxetine protein 6 [Acanthoscelides obtectus]